MKCVGRAALLATASAFAIVSYGAQAQQIQLDGVVVTFSKTAETAIDALAGSSAVSKQQIDQQFQSDRSSEILRTIPGVTTQETARDTAQSINIRGLQDFGRVNVLIDGMRQNFQRSGHSSNGVYYLEPEMVKRIDITRGPTATIYGSGAIGGVAAFEIIDADDILRGNERVAAQLKTRYSTNGSGFFGSATGATRIGNFDIVGQLNGRDVDDYHDGGGNRITNSGEDTTSGLVKARWRPAEGHQITGTFLEYDSNFIDPAVAGPSQILRDTDVKNKQYNLGYTFSRPDTPLVNLSAKVYRNETDLSQTRLSNGAKRFFNVTTEGFDINNTSRFDFGSVKMAVTYGGDAFEDKVVTSDPASNGDELTPSGRRQVAGAFVQNQLTFWNFIDLIGAVRYDTYSLKGGDTDLDGSRVSPKVTLGVTPIKGVTLFSTYAEGYRAPAVTETLIDGFHPQPSPFKLLPNPNLTPEVAHNLEAGVNFKYDGVFTKDDAFRAKFVAFRNKVDDYIGGVSKDPLGNSGTFNGTNPNVFNDDTFQYENIAKVTIDGLELEAAYDARRWFISVGAHHIRGTDDNTGEPLLSIPADQITLTAGFRAFDERLVAGARTRLVAAQDRTPSTPSATVLPTDSYAVLDLFAQYQHTDNLAFNLNIDNVFDKQYLQYLDQSNSPGLNARIGMTMRLGAP